MISKKNSNGKTFNDSSHRKFKWWKVLIGLPLIGLALVFLPLIWIPALVAVVVFCIKKGPHKKRNILLSSLIVILSFTVMMSADYSPPELTGVKVEWDDKKYDISESPEVTITPVPSTAEIESLTLSKNSIATMDYRDGKALITFKAEGSEKLYFIANKNFNSKSYTIKVTDKKAEKKRLAEKKEKERIAAEQAEAERIAAEQAEAERIAAEQAEAERIAAEQAEAERIAAEQAEAERIAAEQAAQEQNTNNNFNTYDNSSQQQTTSNYVLNTNTKKFHHPSCRDVKKIAPQNYSTYDGTRDGIIGQGYSPCGHCTP